MIKHRTHILLLLGISAVVWASTALSAIGHGQIELQLILALLLSIIAGIGLCYISAAFVMRKRTDGVVPIDHGPLGIAALCSLVFGWIIVKRMISYGWLPELCSMLQLKENRLCHDAISLFWSSTVVIFLGTFYVWGLRYEKKTGIPLSYRVIRDAETSYPAPLEIETTFTTWS